MFYVLAITGVLIALLGVAIPVILTLSRINDNQIDFGYNQIPCVEVNSSLKLFKGEVAGGESMAYIGEGKIISGMEDGRIMELDVKKNTAQTLFKIEESRPLGVRLINETLLGVADAKLGFYLYDLKTKKLEFLIKAGDLVEDVPVLFLDDFVYSLKRNMVYISQVSDRFGYDEQMPLMMRGGRHGRILTYDFSTREVNALPIKFAFPNGLELSKDESSLFINEFQRFTTHKYELSSKKLSTFSIYSGYPDNIRSDGNDGYWIGIDAVNKPHVYYLEKFAILRLILSFLLDCKIVSEDFVIASYGSFVHVDHNGKIDRCFYSPDGTKFNQATEVLEQNGMLYIGSFLQDADYIAQLKIHDLY